MNTIPSLTLTKPRLVFNLNQTLTLVAADQKTLIVFVTVISYNGILPIGAQKPLTWVYFERRHQTFGNCIFVNGF